MKQGSFTRGMARGFLFLVLAMLMLSGMNALVMNRIVGPGARPVGPSGLHCHGHHSCGQLLEHTPLVPEQMALLTTLGRSARALLTLLNDLLDLASIEAGKLVLREEMVALRPLLEDVINLFQPKAREKGLELRLSLEDGVPGVVRVDAGRLRQIMLNLLGNAVKFTNAGWVLVRVRGATSTATGEMVRLRFEVQDTGMGIDPLEFHHLFQPFMQAEAVRSRHLGGTGLGLSICQGLVTAMAGEIGVESTQMAGACFWFEIPLGKVPMVTDLVVEDEQLTTIHPLALVVLLVEDEETNLHVAQGMLRLLGCTIHVAENGHQALRLFQEHPVDVVLLDMQLPDMDGLEVAEHLRRLARKPVAIVAMTALTMPADLARYQEALLDGFVAKPILLNKLARELTRLAAKPTGNTPLPLLDPTRLTMYRQDLPNDQVGRIVAACRDTLRQGAEEMPRAWQEGNRLLVGRIAHRLKGAASANGLLRLAQMTETLEQEAKREEAPDLTTQVTELLELVALSMNALDHGLAT